MPFSSSTTPEVSTTPLADYFWIAGVDGSEVLETYQRLGDEYRANRATSPGPAFADTIEEDADAEEAHDPRLDGLSRPGSVVGFRNSFQRFSMRSGDSDPNENGSSSNRSSMTIKGAPQSPRASTAAFFEDFDFDKALFKFASERESFLSDLSLSAGAITSSSRPRSRLRTQKITADESAQSPGLLRSGIGSVRRHMAFRDMNSMKRQPSVARQGKPQRSPRLTQSRDPERGRQTDRQAERKERERVCVLIMEHSVDPYLSSSEQLQLGHPRPPAPGDIPHHASPETKIRACPPRPIPSQSHVR